MIICTISNLNMAFYTCNIKTHICECCTLINASIHKINWFVDKNISVILS